MEFNVRFILNTIPFIFNEFIAFSLSVEPAATATEHQLKQQFTVSLCAKLERSVSGFKDFSVDIHFCL